MTTETSKPMSSVGVSTPAATRTILIVDDDPSVTETFERMLRLEGYHVVTALSAEAGLNQAERSHPHAIILDLRMPLVDGLQFLRTVRSPNEFPYPEVPIILLTGHADRWRVIEAARFGVHEYLLKPVSTKALLDRIAAVLLKPRKMVKLDGYYGPEPRKLVVLPEPDDVLLLK